MPDIFRSEEAGMVACKIEAVRALNSAGAGVNITSIPVRVILTLRGQGMFLYAADATNLPLNKPDIDEFVESPILCHKIF